MSHSQSCEFFFFNDTATTEIYTLSLHDALPISRSGDDEHARDQPPAGLHGGLPPRHLPGRDRKSTRLNSSHSQISYAVFCLKKKNNASERVADSTLTPTALSRSATSTPIMRSEP